MNQQEMTTAVWRAMHQQMSDNFAATNVEVQLLREQAGALKAELGTLKKEKENENAKDAETPTANPPAQ